MHSKVNHVYVRILEVYRTLYLSMDIDKFTGNRSNCKNTLSLKEKPGIHHVHILGWKIVLKH